MKVLTLKWDLAEGVLSEEMGGGDSKRGDGKTQCLGISLAFGVDVFSRDFFFLTLHIWERNVEECSLLGLGDHLGSKLEGT